MKKIVTSLIALSIILCSCSSTFFYSALETTSPGWEKVDNGDFLYENDSLWIAHCFKGEDAPVQITIFNKSDVPLYVDWNRSSLILNNTSYSYNNEQSISTSSSESIGYGDPFWGGVHTTTTTIGTTELPKHVSFIPPKTMITHSTLRLSAQFNEISNKKYAKAKMGTKDNELVNIKRITYNYDNSPLHFGSYITVYTNSQHPTAYKADFHVTHLIKTHIKPDNLPADMAERGDTFYQHMRPNNTGWYILADVAVITGAVAIDVLVFGNDD